MEQICFRLYKVILCFTIASCLVKNALCVMCKNCQMIQDSVLRCSDDCTGEICVLWKWREKGSLQMQLGCISGLDTSVVKMGCRRNTVGAELCLCNNTNGCNDVSRVDMIAMMVLVNLPDLQCRDTITAPYIGEQAGGGVCRSNYCFYTESALRGVDGSRELTSAANCGQLPQYIFDINMYPIWPGPGLFSGGCYLLETEVNEATLGCICHENFCNREVPFPVTPGTVMCYLAYHISNVTEVENGTCRGDFCFIQRTPFSNYGVRFLKGCISVNDTMADSNLQIGYRNFMGLEQWFCDEDLCNNNTDSAEESFQTKLSAQNLSHNSKTSII